MYITREIESTINRLLPQFKVLLVTGARQVGKTTTLKHCYSGSYNYITLDDMNVLDMAKNDPALFFRQYGRPLIIDEVQYAPEIFRRIKYEVDRSDDKGSVILTGSQSYRLMKNVSESLAGRTAILEMPALSLRETLSRLFCGPFAPSSEILQRHCAPCDIWTVIQRGLMPEMQDGTVEWDQFYRNYVKSYLERDVRDLIHLKDEIKFHKFLVSLAARTGQMFVASDVARDVGVSAQTVQSWVSVLDASGLIHILQPYFNNYSKRIVKAPKIYFADTGLACYLLGWDTPKTLENGAMSGQIFETFVVGEIIKSHQNAGCDAENIFYYRDSDKRGIDVVIKDGRVLHPVEIKKSASPDRGMVKNFAVLKNMSGTEVGMGAVVCLAESASYLTENVITVPVEAI